MATTPAFAATVNVGMGSLTTGAGNARDGTQAVTIFTAGASGAKIEEVVIKSDGDAADSTVIFYLHDGSNYFVYDEWDIGNPTPGSTTVASYRESRTYENLLLKNGWTFRAAVTVTPTVGTIKVIASGGDF